MEDYRGRRHALPVRLTEPKPFSADIALNGMDIRRITAQLTDLFSETLNVARGTHKHPGLVPFRSKTGQ